MLLRESEEGWGGGGAFPRSLPILSMRSLSHLLIEKFRRFIDSGGDSGLPP